jgi:hypothetical protein
MALEGVNVGQELLNVPMGEMIRSMALAIADAQWELDKASMTVAEMMSGQRLLRDIDTGKLVDFEGRPLQVDIRNDGVPVQKVERANKKPDDVVKEINESKQVVTPCVVDSRVYFGYTYEPERDAKREIIRVKNKEGNEIPQMIRVPNKVSMMELGFTPTFYQFVDTIIEVKIAIKITRDTVDTRTSRQQEEETVKKDLTVAETKTSTRTSGWGGWWWGRGYSSTTSTETTHRKIGEQTTARASSVDAAYSSKFSFSVEGSSLLRTKLVPVPPPAILEDRIRQVMEREVDYQEQVKLGLMVPKPAPSS